jgi:hypothetical protein
MQGVKFLKIFEVNLEKKNSTFGYNKIFLNRKFFIHKKWD